MHHGMRLGRKRPDPSRKRVVLSDHVDLSALPPCPPEWDGTAGAVFEMWANDRYGDCVLAAVANHAILQAHLDDIRLTFDEGSVLDLYHKLSPNDDGLVPHEAFDYVRDYGFPAGGNYPFIARASIDPANLDHVRLAAYLFGGVLIGAELPLSAQDGGVWIGSGSGPRSVPGGWGGHEMVGGGYDANGVTFVTWGAVQRADWDWFARYVDDVEVLLDARHLAVPGVDGEGLLDAVHALAET